MGGGIEGCELFIGCISKAHEKANAAVDQPTNPPLMVDCEPNPWVLPKLLRGCMRSNQLPVGIHIYSQILNKPILNLLLPVTFLQPMRP